MEVIYDARWLLLDHRFDGVSRYSYELAWAMSRQPGITLIWLVHDERQLAKLPPGRHILANDPNHAKKELFELPATLNAAGARIVYSPFFVMGTRGKTYRLVLTIHDMIYFRHRTPPQWLPWHVRLGWRLFHLTYMPLRRQLNRADIVATVSHTARQELLAARATKREVITVPNAVTQDSQVTSTYHYASNSIVYMGSFTPYKNVECLIDALVELPGVTLHLLSKIPLKRSLQLKQRAELQGVADRILLHNGVSDEAYRAILRDARCLVTASKIEGFGLPIIEAQQQGVPVACSDIPIFREVAGESAVYFDPKDPSACAGAIRALGDPARSHEYIVKGLKNAERFNWDDSARIAVELCKKIASD